MAIKLKLILVLLLLAATPAMAQVNPKQTQEQKDSIKRVNDARYKKVEDYSKNKKFKRFLYKLIFRPVKTEKSSVTRKRIKEGTPEMKHSFDEYQGKIVRNIKIHTLDPFGYSVNDTTAKERNNFERFGNRIHLKTKEMTIRNLLLFKKNRPLDSLLVKESERLIRSQRYVRRVAISPLPISPESDSIDIYVRVLDSWSLIPNGSISSSSMSIELTERNFFGLGHQFENDVATRFSTGETQYLAKYTVPNIKNTYINATVNYQVKGNENSLKSIGVQRDFFSPLTKWAGGVLVESRMLKDSLPDKNNVWLKQTFKYDDQDVWGGYSFQFYKGDSEESRTTRIVTTGRFYNLDYKEHPSVVYDSVGFYTDQQLFLASVGLTSRKYVQDKFLFNYDIVEDIPIGKVYSVTGGVQHKNYQDRIYLGARYAYGNYYKWGYFSINAEVGSFFYKEKSEQTALIINMLYFTNIKNWGKWRFRHFIQPALIFGDNRSPIITDQVTLNGDTGIPGFDSINLWGTKKFLLTLQTQSYSPYNLWGFRLNPFINFTMGSLATENTKLYSDKLYTKIGIGLLLYNDYLVFNSFQLSLAYYPDIPGVGSNVLRANAAQNNNITLPNFQVGKPEVVPYK
jgi:hypothetical protein